jgi:hypothetical protein
MSTRRRPIAWLRSDLCSTRAVCPLSSELQLAAHDARLKLEQLADHKGPQPTAPV